MVQVAAILYIGVVLSDLVTFSLGIALRRGLFRSLKQKLFRFRPRLSQWCIPGQVSLQMGCSNGNCGHCRSDPAAVERAEATVNKWSRAIGAVQRFSLGFRGPLCLVAGFTGHPLFLLTSFLFCITKNGLS